MSDGLSLLETTDAACKAELSQYQSGSAPPPPRRVCLTLRLWSADCPSCVTPAAATWALALRRIQHPAPADTCNGHVSGGDERCATSPAPADTCNGHVSGGDERCATSPAQDAAAAAKTLLAHLRRLADWTRESGSADHLMAVTGSAELAAHQLGYLLQLAELTDGDGALRCQLQAARRLVQYLREQLLGWQRRQLAVRLLTDPDSQDWQHPRAAEEGGRCSFAVQWWWFHMQAVRHDVKESLSAALAGDVFAELLSASLGQLAVHYGHVTLVSEERTTQLLRDVTAVLLCASELVLAVAASPEQLLAGCCDDMDWAGRVAAPCRVLLLLLGHCAAPLRVAARRCGRGCLQSPPACWISLVRPQLVPPSADSLRHLDTNVAIYLQLRLLSAAFPAPGCWPLLARALVARNFTLPVLLLTHLSEHGGNDPEPPAGTPTACHGALCCDADGGCVTLCAVSPQRLFSALVLAVTRATPTWRPLHALLPPCWARLPDSASLPAVWNRRRPLWLQALAQLARPLLRTALASLVQDVQSKSPAGDAESLAVALLHYTCDVVEDLPLALLAAGELPLTPSATPPFGLVVHVLVCGLHDMLTDRPTAVSLAGGGHERRVVDSLAAVGEQLCRPGDTLRAEMTALAEAVCLVAGAPADELDEAVDDEVELAARIGDDHAGRRALWQIAAVLRENCGWLRRQLGVAAPLAEPEPAGGAQLQLSLRPHEAAVFRPCAAMLSMAGGSFDQRQLASFPVDWRRLLTCDLGQTESLVRALVARRWELQPDATLTDDQTELVETLRRRLHLL